MRGGVKAGVIGGVFVVVAGGVGWGAYNVYGGLTGGSDGIGDAQGVSASAAPVRTGPPTATEVTDTAKQFLQKWAAGTDPAVPASLTNASAEAAPYFSDFKDSAHVTKAVITPGTPTGPGGATVPFTVKATVSLGGVSKPWSYRSQLTVVRGETTGKALVDWSPSIVYPGLTATTSLVTSQSPQPPIEAVDRNGQVLDARTYPSLGPILDTLRQKYGEQSGGSPDVTLRVEDSAANADGTSATAPKTLLTLAKGKPGKLRTTLDAKVQAAAETAVKKYTNASVVAVKPSSGDILAVANHRDDAFDAAMQGTQAPGSTMKIITSAMLMEKGLASPARPMECPPTATYEGRVFHNEDGFSLKGSSTMTDAFAQSCNTAFIKLIDDTKDDAAISKEAQEVFGLGLNNWKTGVVSFDGKVPAESGGEAAAEYIGQGKVQMNALNMASVTATVKNGSFHQPVIVPESLDDRQLATAQRQLPSSVSQSIVQMMRVTATSGTAAHAMATLGGDKGAKTGSAEVDGQATSNSWFTAFQDDCAAAAVVTAGGHGADAAGPLVASVLAAD